MFQREPCVCRPLLRLLSECGCEGWAHGNGLSNCDRCLWSKISRVKTSLCKWKQSPCSMPCGTGGSATLSEPRRWPGSGWPPPRPASSSATHYTGGWVALRAGLDFREEQRLPSFHRCSNREPSSPWRVAVPTELSRHQKCLCSGILQALDIRKLDCADEQT